MLFFRFCIIQYIFTLKHSSAKFVTYIVEVKWIQLNQRYFWCILEVPFVYSLPQFNNDFRKFDIYLSGSTFYVWIWQTTNLDSPRKKLMIYVNCSIQHLILWDLHQIVLNKISCFIFIQDLNRSVIHTFFTMKSRISSVKIIIIGDVWV